jgi:DNA-binding FadR family transcriptional regulator
MPSRRQSVSGLAAPTGDASPSSTSVTTMKQVGRGTLLFQAVQDEVKRYIVENNLKPGDPLPPEGELARLLGVGRNSVREAIKALEALGILDVRVGAGLSVRDANLDPMIDGLSYAMLLDFELYSDVREARRYLEQGTVNRVIEGVSDEQLENLRRILDEWRPLAAEGQYAIAQDRAFHEALWANLGNRFLMSVLETFWSAYERLLERSVVTGPADAVVHHASHVAIYEALARRDAEALRQTQTDHYFDVLKRLPLDEGASGQGARSGRGQRGEA